MSLVPEGFREEGDERPVFLHVHDAGFRKDAVTARKRVPVEAPEDRRVLSRDHDRDFPGRVVAFVRHAPVLRTEEEALTDRPRLAVEEAVKPDAWPD